MSLKLMGLTPICGYSSNRMRNRGIQIRLFGCLCIITVAVLFSGCASLAIHREATLPIDRFQAYKGSDGVPILPESVDNDIPDVDILAVSSDMASALDNAIARSKDPKERLDALVKFLLRRIRYDATADNYGAKTARETFESGTGNCLSFSNLFVAMARHAGMKTSYQEIPTPPNWERDGEVLFSTRHIGASVDILEPMGRTILFDMAGLGQALAMDSTIRFYFVPSMLSPSTAGINWPLVSRISDRRAFAQYYNNIGSRYLAEGNGSDAFRYFVKAVKTDPTLDFVWSNLGVVYSRNSQFEAARNAFLHGMALTHGTRDVTALSIMNNMVELYKRSGDEEKVSLYKNEVAAFRRKNPYYQYTLAKKAFNDSRYEQAVRHFKAAIRLKNDEHLFYYGLALSYEKLGNLKKAEKYIRKAKFHAFDEVNKLYYDKVQRDIANGGIN